jgi:hypothetical protein
VSVNNSRFGVAAASVMAFTVACNPSCSLATGAVCPGRVGGQQNCGLTRPLNVRRRPVDVPSEDPLSPLSVPIVSRT